MPAQLKEQMRHETIETTMRYYVGVNAESTAETLWNAVSGNIAGNTTLRTPAQDNTEVQTSIELP